MEPLKRIAAVAAPLYRANIDTDVIIPSREMKTVSKSGLADGMFAGWRYTEPGSRTPRGDFILNRPAYAGARILVAGPNFGCGSSREHAVWALSEYGFRVIIAPSFGSIFHNNCIRNGILPVVLDDGTVRDLADRLKTDTDADTDPDAITLTVDLDRQRIEQAGRDAIPFTIAPQHREMLLNGWDVIDLSLSRADDIDAFEARDRQVRPWAYL